MFIPESYGLALLLMIICMICWGSWANTYKLTKDVRFELFYWDYAIGIFVMALLLAFTLGSWTGGDQAFIPNLTQATGPRLGLAMLGGTVFNLANILLVAAIAIAGLSVAFPGGHRDGARAGYHPDLPRTTNRRPRHALHWCCPRPGGHHC